MFSLYSHLLWQEFRLKLQHIAASHGAVTHGYRPTPLGILKLTGSLECDKQMLYPITFQILPPFLNTFCALYQMDI